MTLRTSGPAAGPASRRGPATSTAAGRGLRRVATAGLALAALLAAEAPVLAQSAVIASADTRTRFRSDAPVADAAERNDPGTVEAFLARGADVNAAQGDGMTALHWAAYHGSADLARLILAADADVTAVTRIGAYTPLHLAARSGADDVVALLLAKGADARAASQGVGGAQPLHFAAGAGATAAVEDLIRHGADVDAREAAWGQTPLMFAAAEGRTDAVRALLAHGADPMARSTAVDITERAARDRLDQQRRDEIVAARREGREPVLAEPGGIEEREAIERRQEYEEANRPIEEPEPLSYADLVNGQGGLTALHHALREGHAETTRALLDGGADVNELTGGDQTSPMLMAMINGHFDLALELLERGGDPTLGSDAGTTPLYAAINTHWAPKSRYPQQHAYKRQDHTYLDVMRILLEAGADPNVRLEKHLWYMGFNFDLLQVDTQGATPFWRAAYALDIDAMKLLLAHGADPEIPTAKVPDRRSGRRGGQTEEVADPSGLPPVPTGGPAVYPIHAATGVGYGQGYAANAHRTVPDGWMPALRFLVEELGADVNERDHEGYTPLHHAASRGDLEMIEYLVEHGADVTAVSRYGQTTADMANGPYQRTQPYPEAVALLEKLGSANNDRCVSCEE